MDLIKTLAYAGLGLTADSNEKLKAKFEALVEAGKKAGLAGGLHVLTGHGSREGEISLARELSNSEYLVQESASIKGAQKLPLFML